MTRPTFIIVMLGWLVFAGVDLGEFLVIKRHEAVEQRAAAALALLTRYACLYGVIAGQQETLDEHAPFLCLIRNWQELAIDQCGAEVNS